MTTVGSRRSLESGCGGGGGSGYIFNSSYDGRSGGSSALGGLSMGHPVISSASATAMEVWLERELELLGVDSSTYAGCLFQLFISSTASVSPRRSPSPTVYPSYPLVSVVDTSQFNRNRAVDLLLNFTNNKQEVEFLVHQLCQRLENVGGGGGNLDHIDSSSGVSVGGGRKERLDSLSSVDSMISTSSFEEGCETNPENNVRYFNEFPSLYYGCDVKARRGPRKTLTESAPTNITTINNGSASTNVAFSNSSESDKRPPTGRVQQLTGTPGGPPERYTRSRRKLYQSASSLHESTTTTENNNDSERVSGSRSSGPAATSHSQSVQNNNSPEESTQYSNVSGTGTPVASGAVKIPYFKQQPQQTHHHHRPIFRFLSCSEDSGTAATGGAGHRSGDSSSAAASSNTSPDSNGSSSFLQPSFVVKKTRMRSSSWSNNLPAPYLHRSRYPLGAAATGATESSLSVQTSRRQLSSSSGNFIFSPNSDGSCGSDTSVRGTEDITEQPNFVVPKMKTTPNFAAVVGSARRGSFSNILTRSNSSNGTSRSKKFTGALEPPSLSLTPIICDTSSSEPKEGESHEKDKWMAKKRLAASSEGELVDNNGNHLNELTHGAQRSTSSSTEYLSGAGAGTHLSAGPHTSHSYSTSDGVPSRSRHDSTQQHQLQQSAEGGEAGGHATGSSLPNVPFYFEPLATTTLRNCQPLKGVYNVLPRRTPVIGAVVAENGAPRSKELPPTMPSYDAPFGRPFVYQASSWDERMATGRYPIASHHQLQPPSLGDKKGNFFGDNRDVVKDDMELVGGGLSLLSIDPPAGPSSTAVSNSPSAPLSGNMFKFQPDSFTNTTASAGPMQATTPPLFQFPTAPSSAPTQTLAPHLPSSATPSEAPTSANFLGAIKYNGSSSSNNQAKKVNAPGPGPTSAPAYFDPVINVVSSSLNNMFTTPILPSISAEDASVIARTQQHELQMEQLSQLRHASLVDVDDASSVNGGYIDRQPCLQSSAVVRNIVDLPGGQVAPAAPPSNLLAISALDSQLKRIESSGNFSNCSTGSDGVLKVRPVPKRLSDSSLVSLSHSSSSASVPSSGGPTTTAPKSGPATGPAAAAVITNHPLVSPLTHFKPIGDKPDEDAAANKVNASKGKDCNDDDVRKKKVNDDVPHGYQRYYEGTADKAWTAGSNQSTGFVPKFRLAGCDKGLQTEGPASPAKKTFVESKSLVEKRLSSGSDPVDSSLVDSNAARSKSVPLGAALVPPPGPGMILRKSGNAYAQQCPGDTNIPSNQKHVSPSRRINRSGDPRSTKTDGKIVILNRNRDFSSSVDPPHSSLLEPDVDPVVPNASTHPHEVPALTLDDVFCSLNEQCTNLDKSAEKFSFTRRSDGSTLAPGPVVGHLQSKYGEIDLAKAALNAGLNDTLAQLWSDSKYDNPPPHPQQQQMMAHPLFGHQSRPPPRPAAASENAIGISKTNIWSSGAAVGDSLDKRAVTFNEFVPPPGLPWPQNHELPLTVDISLAVSSSSYGACPPPPSSLGSPSFVPSSGGTPSSKLLRSLSQSHVKPSSEQASPATRSFSLSTNAALSIYGSVSGPSPPGITSSSSSLASPLIGLTSTTWSNLPPDSAVIRSRHESNSFDQQRKFNVLPEKCQIAWDNATENPSSAGGRPNLNDPLLPPSNTHHHQIPPPPASDSFLSLPLHYRSSQSQSQQPNHRQPRLMCKDWIELGHCSKNDLCNFSHSH